MYGVGIVGCGYGGVLASFWNKNPKSKVVGMFDVDKSKSKKLQETYKSSRIYDSINDLLKSPDIDIVHIATPPKFHCDIVELCGKAGKHILCEKPMSLSLKESKKMINAVDRDGLVSAVNFPGNYVKQIDQFKSLVESGYLGELKRMKISIRMKNFCQRPWVTFDHDSWLNSREQGGALREFGVHMYFALLKIFGEDFVEEVLTSVKYSDNIHAEHSALGIFKLKNDCMLSFDFLSEIEKDEKMKMTAIGSKGSIALVDFQYLFCAKGSEKLKSYDENSVIPKQLKLMDPEPIVQNFLNAIEIDDPSKRNIVSFKFAAKVQNLLDAIQNSNGKWINLKEQEKLI